jgi:acyl transferase domain-containing protein
MELASGKSDIVVTGGIDTFNDIFMYMCFSKTPALSPTGNARPFDTAADGTILGEGLGIVVVKRLADAERDGDRIYAVIRGIGSSSDGKGDAIYAPSASGQKMALLNAYQNAGVTPASIGLVEAHGTGTRVGDAVEVSALREVYGAALNPWCCLGSVKSQIGHAKAASGAAGLIKAALALHHKVIPPTIKVQTPLKEITSGQTPFYIAAEKRPWFRQVGVPRRAGVSAFGFGGSNFHVVLEEYRPSKKGADWDGNTQIVAFSGADAAALDDRLGRIQPGCSWKELRDLAAVSRAGFDVLAPCRLTLVVERNSTNLAALLKNARAMLGKSPHSPWHTPDGAYFAAGAKPGQLGMLFPGQGSQYTGMLNDLACRFPQLLDSIGAANDRFASGDGKLLSDIIYPVSAFDPQTKSDQDQALRATQAAQPAIGAASLGALRLLESFGVEPSAVAGHSYGELTALCAAGCLEEDALHSLSRLRGRLMGEGKGDKGSMLAVSAPLAKVSEIIAQEKLDLVIANRNAPSQAVLSGATREIARAAALFSAASLTCKKLPVAAAFHSPLVADAAAPFLAALEKVALNKARLPVYANTTAGIYPADAAQAKALLAAQLGEPVEFVAEIEAMYAAGVTGFLEVGPGNRLTGLVQAILGERPHLACALDASTGKRSGVADLARMLAQLAALGYGVKLAAWDEGHRPEDPSKGKKPVMTVPLCGANYLKPKTKKPPVLPARMVCSAAPSPQPPQAAAVSAAPSLQPGAAAGPRQTVSHAALSESLRMTRESMAVLQKMQEDTAQLHRRFLEGQESATRTFQTLLEQQHQLIMGAAAAPLHATSSEFKVESREFRTLTRAAATPTGFGAASSDSGVIRQTLLAVVSEKTGYPVEMLELDMGLDSDLGIDSIKRVEILSTLQERLPGTPVIGPEHLGSLRTLGEIASHLTAGASSGAVPGVAAVAAAASPVSAAQVTETLLAVVSEKTGYPVEMLELDMGLDSDLGIDSIKRVEILSTLQERLPGTPVIGPEHLGSLRTLGEIAAHL